MVRFYIHQNALNAGSINLSVVEMKDKENITTTLWWSSKNQGPDWIRIDAILPNITSKYFMQFEARMGMRIYSDVAVDDFSLAPECFGLNIPLEDLRGYNYWDPHVPINKKAQPDFENKSSILLSNCGKTGNEGPSQADCTEVYNNTDSIRILDRHPFKGMQIWKVPNEGYYTIIAKGAGGGMGSGGVGSSRGAVAVSVLELHKDEEIYILVGQSGEDACIKTMGHRDETCETKSEIFNNSYASKTQMVKKISIEDGAGGGGKLTNQKQFCFSNVFVPFSNRWCHFRLSSEFCQF
jgi:anaplastic lymphoma kinase